MDHDSPANGPSGLEKHSPEEQSLQPRSFGGLVRSYETIDLAGQQNLLAYWRVLRRRSWTVLTVWSVFFLLIVIGTLRQTPVFRATALLEIERDNANMMSLEEMFEFESVTSTYLETQFRILESSSLSRRVVEQLQLYRFEEFAPPKGGLFGWRKGESKKDEESEVFALSSEQVGLDGVEWNEVSKKFRERLSIHPVKGSRLVEVSIEAEDAALAAQIVNSLAANYIEQNLEARYEATQIASEWLSRQLVNLKIRLEQAEQELQAYAMQHGLLFLEGEGRPTENIENSRLRQLQEELTKAMVALYARESLYQLVLNGDLSALPGTFENRAMQEMTFRLAELKGQRADLATIFSPDYPKMQQLQRQIDELESMLAEQRSLLAKGIENNYLAAQGRVTLLQSAFAREQVRAGVVAEKSVQYNILKREVDTSRQLYDGLLQRLREAGVSAGLKASSIRIVDPAWPPDKPVRPRVLLNLALGLSMGLMLGVGAAFLQDYLDSSLKSAEDVERYLRIPALVVVPAMHLLNGHGNSAPPSKLREGLKKLGKKGWLEVDPSAGSVEKKWYRIEGKVSDEKVMLESFRSLRTSILLSAAERPPRVILVASALPEEGKTTISCNLAISLAQLGRHVLLIDSDLRRPAANKLFNLTREVGIVNCLTGQRELRDVVQPSGTDGLDVLVCGPIPPNPAELLSSEKMEKLLAQARETYDFVIMDSPPVLRVADARVLARLTDGVVLVVRSTTPRDVALRAQAYIQSAGGWTLGAVLNSVDISADSGYYYSYYAYHYELNDDVEEDTLGNSPVA